MSVTFFPFFFRRPTSGIFSNMTQYCYRWSRNGSTFTSLCSTIPFFGCWLPREDINFPLIKDLNASIARDSCRRQSCYFNTINKFRWGCNKAPACLKYTVQTAVDEKRVNPANRLSPSDRFAACQHVLIVGFPDNRGRCLIPGSYRLVNLLNLCSPNLTLRSIQFLASNLITSLIIIASCINLQ